MKKNRYAICLLVFLTIFGTALPLFAQSRSRCASGLCNKGKKSGKRSPSDRKQFSQRGITAGKNTLNVLFSPVVRTGDIDIGLSLLHVGGINFTNNGDPRILLGAAYGINDTIELGGYLLNITNDAGDDTELYAPFFWAAARVSTDSSEYALRIGIAPPVRDAESLLMHFATPVFIPVGGSSSLEVALAIDGIFADPQTQWIFAIPLRITTNITKEVFAGVKSSFILPEFEGVAMIIPLGVFAGYTVVVDKQPLADIGLGFNFPLFVAPGFNDEGEASKQVITEIYEIGVGANFTFRF